MELNVKVRFRGQSPRSTKVNVGSEDPALALKKKICEKIDDLEENMMVVTYGGCELDDNSLVCSYDLFDGATVHVYKRYENESKTIKTPKVYSENELIRLGIAFRSLASNSALSRLLLSKTTSTNRNDLILQYPELAKDPVVFTLLQYPSFLSKLGDIEVLRRLVDEHPLLIQIIYDINASVPSDLQARQSTGTMPTLFANAASDDEMEDVDIMDDSSPASEADSQPVSMNSSFGITTAHLASAIASVTTQPGPSTSGASTSAGITTTDIENAFNRFVRQNNPTETDYTAHLQIMRDMGLANDSINLQALRLSRNLESAINLVLSGYTGDEN